jgi:hypothetical protein
MISRLLPVRRILATMEYIAKIPVNATNANPNRATKPEINSSILNCRFPLSGKPHAFPKHDVGGQIRSNASAFKLTNNQRGQSAQGSAAIASSVRDLLWLKRQLLLFRSMRELSLST